MGYKKYPQKVMANQAKQVKIGTKVLVYPGPGEDPFLAIVNEIDIYSGIIISVIIKDANKKEKVIGVKNKIVTLVPLFYSLFRWIRSLWK